MNGIPDGELIHVKNIYINALLKISVFVWTGLFRIVSIYKYNQNHFVLFFHFFHIQRP